MKESNFIWMNGSVRLWKESNTHFLSHALHYGSAIFEGIRCYDTKDGPAIFRLNEHIDRLFNSAKIFGMQIPYTKEEIIFAAKEMIAVNKLSEGYIRPLAYYSSGGLGFDMTNQGVDVGVAAWQWGAMLGAKSVEEGISVKISPYFRPSSDSMPVNAKVSGNYANSIMAKMDAIKSGYTDAIMTDKYGFVAECSAENFFGVKNNTLYTPTINNCLNGITRNSIIQLAKDEGFEIIEENITPEKVFEMDECFACGTAAEIVPITSIDKKPIGKGVRGEITFTLQKEYQKVIHGENEKYSSWLTLVK